MGWFHRKPLSEDLPARCRQYLETGPPPQMTDYVPGSLTEVIIVHGAESCNLDPELREIGGIILAELSNFSSYSDPAIREYMQQGVKRVEEVLSRNA